MADKAELRYIKYYLDEDMLGQSADPPNATAVNIISFEHPGFLASSMFSAGSGTRVCKPVLASPATDTYTENSLYMPVIKGGVAQFFGGTGTLLGASADISTNVSAGNALVSDGNGSASFTAVPALSALSRLDLGRNGIVILRNGEFQLIEFDDSSKLLGGDGSWKPTSICDS